MGCLNCSISKGNALSCIIESIVKHPSLKYLYNPLSININSINRNLQTSVISLNYSSVFTHIKSRLLVVLAVDVTDIYTDIHIDCNVNYAYQHFLVDGMPFKLIDGKIFKVLKNELQL